MNKIKDILLGVAVGDALGVPVEFKSRLYLYQKPVKDMIGYRVYNQPPGTWSDDSSLTFCLAESLVLGYDLMDISRCFINWKTNAYWTAHNEVFDIGITTANALDDLGQILYQKDEKRLKNLIYEGDEFKNGNGSLMRIAPLLCYIKGKELAEQFKIIKEVSALTHRHIRAAIACLVYLNFMEHLLGGISKEAAYKQTQETIGNFLDSIELSQNEWEHFDRILNQNIADFPEDQINSSGYVIHSLEASFWCILHSDNYSDAVLKAVNLGIDTDTTAAITGGLAGLIYGMDAIPEHWLNQLARRDDIEYLAKKLNDVYPLVDKL